MATTNNVKLEPFKLTDCSEANSDFVNQFHGIFTSQLAVYLRDTGKCSATVVDDTDPLFKQKFENLRSLLERKYVAQVKATSKCDSLAAAFKKNNHLPNVATFLKANERQINTWALTNIFDSNVPHLGSQTDAGVAVTLYQEFVLIHDMLIPEVALHKQDKLQIMLRSIAISQLLLTHTLSKLGLPNNEQSRYTAMANPQVKAHFENLVTFPKFRQQQINEIPQARAYQEEVLGSFREDLKPDLKKTKRILIATSVAASIFAITTAYLLSRRSKKSEKPSRKVAQFGQEPRLTQEPSLEQENDTLVDYPVYRKSASRIDEVPAFESDPKFHARTDLKPISY